MTDNETIKALECCLSSNDLMACWKCPAVKLDICCDGSTKISNGIVNSVLDLINRQKAEIERLRNTVKTDFLTVTEKLKLSQSEIRDIRAEAIKEFAERLKEKLYGIPTVYNSHFSRLVDTLVEEMKEYEE